MTAADCEKSVVAPPWRIGLEIWLLNRPDSFEGSTGFWVTLLMGAVGSIQSFSQTLLTLIWLPFILYGTAWAYTHHRPRLTRVATVADALLDIAQKKDDAYFLELIDSGSERGVAIQLAEKYPDWRVDGLPEALIERSREAT